MIGNRIAYPASAHPNLAPRAWMLHYESLGIIRDFHVELPGTVQYTFTRYFSTRRPASVAETVTIRRLKTEFVVDRIFQQPLAAKG